MDAPARTRRRNLWQRSLVAVTSQGLIEGSVRHEGGPNRPARIEIAGGPSGARVEFLADGVPVAAIDLDIFGTAAMDLDATVEVLARAALVVSDCSGTLLRSSPVRSGEAAR